MKAKVLFQTSIFVAVLTGLKISCAVTAPAITGLYATCGIPSSHLYCCMKSSARIGSWVDCTGTSNVPSSFTCNTRANNKLPLCPYQYAYGTVKPMPAMPEAANNTTLTVTCSKTAYACCNYKYINPALGAQWTPGSSCGEAIAAITCNPATTIYLSSPAKTLPTSCFRGLAVVGKTTPKGHPVGAISGAYYIHVSPGNYGNAYALGKNNTPLYWTNCTTVKNSAAAYTQPTLNSTVTGDATGIVCGLTRTIIIIRKTG